MPEPEADAEPDTGDSQSWGIISNADGESDSDIDSRPCEAAKAKRIERQSKWWGLRGTISMRRLVYNLEPAHVVYIYVYKFTPSPKQSSTLRIASVFIFGHIF